MSVTSYHRVLRPFVVVLVAAVILLFAAALPTFADGPYVVQAGDSLSTIAAHFGVSVDAIVKANGLADPNVIFAGQSLSIPGSATAAAPAPATQVSSTAPEPEASAPAPAPVVAAPESAPPSRLVIPSIDLDTQVTPSGKYKGWIAGQLLEQQYVPPYTAGWHNDTARPGEGNTVMSAHHNIYGKVFGNLVNIEVGAPIAVFAGGVQHDYVVTQKMILREEGMPLATRLANAKWMDPTDDSRLTLVTCWPAWTNTHRLIVVAEEVK
ncbi:MAG: sortase [Anaerolineae bacterium]